MELRSNGRLTTWDRSGNAVRIFCSRSSGVIAAERREASWRAETVSSRPAQNHFRPSDLGPGVIEYSPGAQPRRVVFALGREALSAARSPSKGLLLSFLPHSRFSPCPASSSPSTREPAPLRNPLCTSLTLSLLTPPPLFHSARHSHLRPARLSPNAASPVLSTESPSPSPAQLSSPSTPSTKPEASPAPPSSSPTTFAPTVGSQSFSRSWWSRRSTGA